MTKKLLKGNEALVYGALLGGCTHYFGYPITPASEIAHAASSLFPKCGRHFLQSECETASISMLYGAAAAGARCLTGTSGLGLSLMAEQLSYMAGAELPCVVCDVQRVGPGLGNIWPEQSDYNCTVKGGGHGSYHAMVYAPDSAQEMFDMMYHAFDHAEKYRTPLIILSDAYIGQMMEPVSFPHEVKHAPRHDWALYADEASRHNVVTSIYMNPQEMNAINEKLIAKYVQMQNEDVEYEAVATDDATTIIVAFGIASRIAKGAVHILRNRGYKIGLIRPKTLFPFPKAPILEAAHRGVKLISFELNAGQMIDDVRLSAECKTSVTLINAMGGFIPTSENLIETICKRDLL